MTNASLVWGCAFVAFGPSVSLLFLIAYQKAQLIIVVTTSAFAYLLAALFASFVWYLFDLAGIGDVALIILLPGVIFQCLARCAFVHIYHKVEKVIEISIARHEEREEEFHESAKLRLELNDWACGIAAGVGFGGMHAVMLYGTLLASEAGNLGTLYQDACPNIPSLALSAFNAFMFSLLDIVWMLLTFYGMRNITLYDQQTANMPDWNGNTRTWGALVGTSNNKRNGQIALGTCMLSHLLAALATMPNQNYKGCRVSLSMLAMILLMTSLLFWGGFSKLFLPDNQRHRLGMNGPPSPSQHRD